MYCAGVRARTVPVVEQRVGTAPGNARRVPHEFQPHNAVAEIDERIRTGTSCNLQRDIIPVVDKRVLSGVTLQIQQSHRVTVVLRDIIAIAAGELDRADVIAHVHKDVVAVQSGSGMVGRAPAVDRERDNTGASVLESVAARAAGERHCLDYAHSQQHIVPPVAAEIQAFQNRTCGVLISVSASAPPRNTRASSAPSLINVSAPSSPRKSRPPRMEPVAVLISVSASEPPLKTRPAGSLD